MQTLAEATMALRNATGPQTPHWSPRAFSRAVARHVKATGAKRSKVAAELALVAEVTIATTYNWKNGTGAPSLDQAFAMAALLGCDLMDFTE